MDIGLATKKSEKVFTFDLIGSNYMLVYAFGRINVTTKEPVEVLPGVFGHKVINTKECPDMNYDEFKDYAKQTILVNNLVHGGISLDRLEQN